MNSVTINHYTNEKYDYVRYETKIDIIKTMIAKGTLQSHLAYKVEKDLELMYEAANEFLEHLREELDQIQESDNYKRTEEVDQLEEEIYDAEKIVKQISMLLDHF